MKTIYSDFIVKGHKHGNRYYIVKNEMGNYDVYQIFCELNNDMGASDIKSFLPSIKHLNDDDIIVSFPNEQYNGFLLLYNIEILEMNGFRITLENEEIIL